MAPKKRIIEPISINSTVIAKLKGYPDWPGQVVHNDQAPLKIRKKSHPTDNKSYLIKFYPTGDLAWIPAGDVKILATKTIENYLNTHKKGKKDTEIRKGYEVALDPTEWESNIQASLESWKELNQIQTQQDEMEEDQLDQDESSSTNKKRKRATEPKETKVRESAADKRKRAKLSSDAKPKKKVAASYSDDEPESTTKKVKDPSVVEPEGLIQVRDWRHKLQKVFLNSKGDPINPDDMAKSKEYFDAIDEFVMTKEWLAESKLGKVLKRVVQIAEGLIPQEETYKFRERAADILNKWTVNLSGTEPAPIPQVVPTEVAEEVVPVQEPVKMDEDLPASAVVVEKVAAVIEDPAVEAPVAVEEPITEPASIEVVPEVVVAEPVVAEVAPEVELKIQVEEIVPIVENGTNGESGKVEEPILAAEPVVAEA